MLSPLPVVIVTSGGDCIKDGATVPSGYAPNAVTVAWCGIACTQPPSFISLCVRRVIRIR